MIINVDPGELRNRVIILEQVKAFDEAGSLIESWEHGIGFKELHTVWAKVTPIGAKDYFEAMSNQMQVTHKIIMRYIPGITHKNYIKFNGRKLDIIRLVNYNEENRWLEINAVECI